MRKVLVLAAVASTALPLGAAASASAGALDQQQATTNSGTASLIHSSLSEAQTFTAGITGGLDEADLHLEAFSGPSADLTIEIRDASATGPGSQILAGRIIPPSSVGPASGGFVPVGFNPPAPVVAGHQYAIVAYTPASSSNDYAWTYAATDLYPSGGRFQVASSPPSGSWTSVSGDFAFKTYVVPTPTSSATTGQRAAALASCKKRAHKHHWSHKRLKKCKRKANLLPV